MAVELTPSGTRGVKMPNFFGYMLWSAVVLLPVFAVLTVLLIARGA